MTSTITVLEERCAAALAVRYAALDDPRHANSVRRFMSGLRRKV